MGTCERKLGKVTHTHMPPPHMHTRTHMHTHAHTCMQARGFLVLVFDHWALGLHVGKCFKNTPCFSKNRGKTVLKFSQKICVNAQIRTRTLMVFFFVLWLDQMTSYVAPLL